MTVVVADTSPLNYLILVGEIGILSQLYGRIVVPEEVFAELGTRMPHRQFERGLRGIRVDRGPKSPGSRCPPLWVWTRASRLRSR